MNHANTRNKHFLMMFLFSYLFTNAHARIWRVNNNAGISADTTSLIAAVALAASGDTIYLEPSATSYDPSYNVTINKRLKIFGNGSFLSAHPGLQINPNDSYFPNYLTFERGSSGSAIYGIRAGHITINDSINDITIQRCRTAITVYGSGTKLNILENWLSGFSRQSGGTRTDLMIRNNIFTSSLSVLRTDVGIIQNNTIHTYYYTGLHLNDANQITVINNLLLASYSSYTTISGGSSASFSNNICTDNSLPEGSGNQNNVPIANILVNTNFTTR
jgi:hypothetical protein